MSVTEVASLAVGDAAPDFSYRDAAGSERRLSEFWSEAPALVVWLRHMG